MSNALSINPLGTVAPPEQEAPKIASERYRHTIVESSLQPETGLLTMYDGVPTLAEVYVPRIGADEESSPFGPSNVPVYQSYERIKNMILFQDGDGAFNFDPETAESTQELTVYWIANNYVPKKWTVFIMDIGDGYAGLFQVKENPQIMNLTANKGYQLTCQFIQILTEFYHQALVQRTVKDLSYSKDSALHGGSAIVTDGVLEMGEKLFQWNGTIANYIMREHYWDPERTIAFKGSGGRGMIYDQYLVNFICATMPPDYRNTYPIINQFGMTYGGREFGGRGDINIWEVLLRGDFNLLPECKKEAAIIDVGRIVQTRMYGSLRSSKFEYFVATDPERYLAVKSYNNIDGYPIIAPSKEETIPTYLFSEEFYAGNPQGEFENLVVDALKKKFVSHERLLAYCEGFFTLDERERLYHGAILLLLLQVARKLRSPL